jgi:ribosomal-protein-alanine N-acetyltransferase
LNGVKTEKPETTFAIATATEAIGCIGLRLGSDIHRKTAELGYWLGEPFWDQGIMSEGVAGFTRNAFETYDLTRIYAEPFASSRASARVLEKAGFNCEGQLFANVIKDGRIQDSLLYARLREGSR